MKVCVRTIEEFMSDRLSNRGLRQLMSLLQSLDTVPATAVNCEQTMRRCALLQVPGRLVDPGSVFCVQLSGSGRQFL